MRAMETTPADSLNAGEKIALVGREQGRVSHVATNLKSVGGDRPPIGLSLLGAVRSEFSDRYSIPRTRQQTFRVPFQRGRVVEIQMLVDEQRGE
jgi:hypothetical protein